jgi:primosomal protein N' (replication factor Y)
MVEEEVAGLFPEHRIDRMDLDTTRSRKKYERIIRSFESGATHILIGTQIVTKGLDFDHVGLVGVLNADNLIAFPDFRSYERSYQLLSQVAGRSGRKEKEGTVIIQTSLPEHPVFQQVLHGNYHKAYMSQMEDRQAFHYPPYYRLLNIIMRHSDRQVLDPAARELATALRQQFHSLDAGKADKPKPRVLGPQSPVIGRVQNMNISTILLKLPRTEEIKGLKELTGRLISEFRSHKNYRNLTIIPDVDPY